MSSKEVSVKHSHRQKFVKIISQNSKTTLWLFTQMIPKQSRESKVEHMESYKQADIILPHNCQLSPQTGSQTHNTYVSKNV